MPFLTRFSRGPWIEKNTIRLMQLKPNSPKTYFTFDEHVAYTSQPSTGSPIHEGKDSPTYYDLVDAIIQNPDHVAPRDENWWQTDLASVPQFLWGVIPSYGKHTLSALMHDRLCVEAHEFSRAGRAEPGITRFKRRHADLLFRISAADGAGMGLARRWLMWTAVRLGGWLPVAVLTVLLGLTLPFFVIGEIGALTAWISIPVSDWSTPMVLAAVFWWPLILLGLLVQSLLRGIDVLLSTSVPLSQLSFWPLVPVALAVGLTAAVGFVSIEKTEFDWMRGSTEPGRPVTSEHLPPSVDEVKRWTEWRRPSASFGSMFGAAILGIVAAPCLLPVSVVTIATRATIWVCDAVGELACWLGRRGRRRVRFSVFTLPAPERTEAPGDIPVPLPLDGGHVVIVDRHNVLGSVESGRIFVDMGHEWVVGVLVSDKADTATKQQIIDWIEDRFGYRAPAP